MKKLMLAAAIVCAAVSAQASLIINAGLSNVCHPTAEGFGGASTGTCDLYAYKTDPSQAVLVSDVANMGGGSFSLEEFNWEGGSGSVSDWNYYFVLFDKDENGRELTINSLTAQLPYDINDYGAGDTINNFDYTYEWGQTTAMAENWEPVGAPEPTSAMLMLLGVAGLALKRKQK